MFFFSGGFLACLFGSSNQKLQSTNERCFAEIGVRREAAPHYNFFSKSIYKGVQFYKISKHRACNFTGNRLKKMIRD